MKVMRIKYVRKHPQGQPIGCVVLLEDGRIGWSQCCPKDQFSKEKGKAIAIRRALMDDVTLPYGTNKKPALVKVTVNQWAMNGHWHYQTARVDLVGNIIEDMFHYWDGRNNYGSES